MQVILITGPVASGKSTVARTVAARMRTHGLRAASIDMDDLIFMQNGTDWRTVDGTHWATARKGAAALVDSFIAAGLQVVAVSGPLFGKSERDELVQSLTATPTVHVKSCCKWVWTKRSSARRLIQRGPYRRIRPCLPHLRSPSTGAAFPVMPSESPPTA